MKFIITNTETGEKRLVVSSVRGYEPPAGWVVTASTFALSKEIRHV